MITLSLIHSTARPQVCENTILKLFSNTDNVGAVEHCLTYEKRFFTEKPKSSFPNQRIRETEGTPVDGYNRAAEMSSGKVLFFFSDDVYPYKHWDTQIISALGDLTKPAALLVRVVAETKEGWLNCHEGLCQFPICTRPYYEQLQQKCGGFLNPCYFARFSDMEFTKLARRDGVLIDAREKIKFYHIEERDIHCVMEATREKMLQEHIRDEVTFFEREKLGFPPNWPAWRSVPSVQSVAYSC
jgi:hypothetical protein